MSAYFRTFVVILATCFTALAAQADSDAPCTASLRDKLKIANTAPEVCETTTRLVTGRAVVVALWSTEPDSPPDIPLAAVLDEKALVAGRKVYLYKRKAGGESLQPFLFDGKPVKLAIADFDGSGRMGWAMWIVPDADYSFDITLYDPKTKKFVEPHAGDDPTTFTATDLDAMVRVAKGQILIPVCDSSGGSPAHPTTALHFDAYRAKAGHFENAGRIAATAATAAEQAKCKAMGQ